MVRKEYDEYKKITEARIEHLESDIELSHRKGIV